MNHPAFALHNIGNIRDVPMLCGFESYRDWEHAETVVEEGYQSPYHFGNVLRGMVEDDRMPVFRLGKVYFCLSIDNTQVAIYNPDKRQPGEVLYAPVNDWFAAAYEL